MIGPLLAECLAALDDDAPRLVWADAEGGPRGELVVVQCDLARGGLAPAASGVRRRRQRELLATYGRAWSGLDDRAVRCRYRRGFVEYAAFDDWDIVDRFDAIFASAPFLDSIEFIEKGSSDLEAIFRHPRYAAIRGLGMRPLDANAIARVVETNAFAQLTALDVSIDARVSSAEMVSLLRPHHFKGIERLRFNPRDDAHATELLVMMPRLRSVDLMFCRDAASVLPAISRTLVELTIHADALGALASGPLAAGIERLSLRHVASSEALRVLSAFPHLRSLDLDMQRRSKVELDPSFTDIPLPALRELRCTAMERDTALAIGEALGAQLELFAPGTRFGDDRDLQARFAGEFYVTQLTGAGPALFTTELPNAPMWDYPRVMLGPMARPDL